MTSAPTTGQPLVIKHNGKAAGVVLSPERFDELTERARFSEPINAGLADSDAGRVLPHEVVVERMQTWAETTTPGPLGGRGSVG
jgi:PHD/YefM family antitoxin component YafN of YafNO toxin-antitoxin module